MQFQVHTINKDPKTKSWLINSIDLLSKTILQYHSTRHQIYLYPPLALRATEMKEYFSKNKTRNLYARRDALPSQCDHRKLVGEVLSAERLKFCLKARWQHQLHSSRKFLISFYLSRAAFCTWYSIFYWHPLYDSWSLVVLWVSFCHAVTDPFC